MDQIRSVHTGRFKYIRNYYPERPLLQPSNYKDSKPILQRLRALHAAGRFDALQERILFAPQRAPEEMYDVQTDPWETVNLATDPRHRSMLLELCGRLERWRQETGDRGPESPEAFEQEMAHQLSKLRGDAEARMAVEANIAVMRRWAVERPLRVQP